MDQYDLDFESILHHADDMKSKWTEVSEKYKSILSSLKVTNIKYEQTKIELESYKIRAKKAETEKDKMMLIVKELYKEKRSTNPFSETLNKLERIILTAQNDNTQKNHLTNSSIGEIPCRSIVSSNISNDSTQQSFVDPMPLSITQVKTELTESNDSTSNQDNGSLMANSQTLLINPNSIQSIHATSTPLVHPEQQLFLNDELNQDETSEHDNVNKNELSYEFIEFEAESAEGISRIQNNHVDVDPLSLSDKSSCIRKSMQSKPVRLLGNKTQQETSWSNAMNVTVSLPRINVSNFSFRNSQSNEDCGILEAPPSSTVMLEKRPNKSVSCIPSPSISFEENDLDILFDDDVDEDNEYSRPRRCLICKKKNSKSILYATYQDLDDHILRYHPEPLPVYRRCPYEDGKCRRHFSTPKELQQHVKLRHQNEMFVKSSITHESPQNVIRRCIICDESFLNLHDLKNHINQSHHGVSEPVKCQTCGIVFSTSKGLYLHKSKSRRCNRMIAGKTTQSLENSQFFSKCKICLKENPQEETYYNKKNLDVHILQNHPNSYPDYFRCPHLKGEAECNRHLTSMPGYQVHVKRYHQKQDLYISSEKAFPGQKIFKCTPCGKRFLSRAHLLQHSQLYCTRANNSVVSRKKS